MATRRRRGQEGEGSALANCAARMGDLWAEFQGDRRRNDDYFVSNASMVSHLPLQMLITLNGYFSLCWAVVWVTLYAYKYTYWRADLLSAFLNPVLFAIWALIEPLRLWFGNTGNLSEKVANLAAFFLLTLFPQFFAHVMLLGAPTLLLPFEALSGALMLVMLAFEAFFSYKATKTLINRSTAQFHLQYDEMGGAAQDHAE